LACPMVDSLLTGPPNLERSISSRSRTSSFGEDEELASELPPDWTLRKFQKEVKSVLTEYFISLLADEATCRVRELLAACPSEADELAVLAIRSGLERDGAAQLATVELLCGLNKASMLDGPALIRSFEKLFCTWEDIAIDVPKAPTALLGILEGCVVGGIVGRELLTKLPESLLSAGLGEAASSVLPGLAGSLAQVAAELREFKRQATRSLQEYFTSHNADEVATFLGELSMQPYHHEFVKKVITMSFAQSNEEAAREVAIVLLTRLSATEVISKDDLQWGVTRLLGQLDDLELDCPRCVELATELCTCLIADELVSAPFLRRCRLLRIGGAAGLRVLDGTQRRTPEYSKKCLGAAQFKRELHTMILEYFDSGDEAEFGRCVRELAPLFPDQSAELIRKVMIFAMERSACDCARALRLLIWLCRHEELSHEAMELGFNALYTGMPDLLLDVPNAQDIAQSFVEEAKKAKVLRKDWPDAPEG